MTRYIDGFILPLDRNQVDAYREHAEAASRIWKEHGALEYCECVGDDLTPTDETDNFPRMAGASDGETVVFAWAAFESRAARDAANEKIMADPRLAEMMEKSTGLFDCRRMAYGGFRVLVRA